MEKGYFYQSYRKNTYPIMIALTSKVIKQKISSGKTSLSGDGLVVSRSRKLRRDYE